MSKMVMLQLMQLADRVERVDDETLKTKIQQYTPYLYFGQVIPLVTNVMAHLLIVNVNFSKAKHKH